MALYEPKTDFGEIDKGSDTGSATGPAGGGQVDPNWKPDPKNPLAAPPGIPQSMWQSFLDQDFGPNGQYKNAWKHNPAGMAAGLFKTYVLPQWNSFTPAQKQQYSNTDASGNPYTPGTPEAQEWDRQKGLKDTQETNQTEFEDWKNQFLPGVADAMGAAQAGDKDALAKLQELLGGIKDPEIAKYVGDYASKAAEAAPDQRDVEAQQRQLAKLEGLSDPRITAEERLMMEMSRRQTENDLKGQRGALANNLQARGVYGSGSELTMNLAAQQEAAQRQALEMLGAQSNASKRAMESLKGAGTLSTAMRDSSAKESQFRGTAADKAAEFNNTLRQNYENWKTDQQFKANKDKVASGELTFNATTGVNAGGAARVLAPAELGLKAAMGKTGQLSGDSGTLSGAQHDNAVLSDKEKTEQELKNL